MTAALIFHRITMTTWTVIYYSRGRDCYHHSRASNHRPLGLLYLYPWISYHISVQLNGCNVLRIHIGEPVSMLEHALQAAHCAQLARSSDEEVLGTLLHDIGHMIGMDSIASGDESQYKQMDDCGIMDHEEIGA